MATASTIEMGDDYDAFEAMLNRGAFLRKLREMEAADEAERAAALEEGSDDDHNNNNNTPNTPSDTLDYEAAYLDHQRYYDDYKHVNYRFIDFGNVNIRQGNKENSNQPLSARLLIEQDRSMGKGGLVWDAGFILAEHVILEQESWKPMVQRSDADLGKPIQIVELGAGTGITGLMVASAMAEEVHVALTDLPELMPLLNKNLAHNPSVQASAFPLAWGTDVQGSYDVILGADVVAGIYDPIKLAKTICDLCHENTLVCISINSRLHEAIATFEEAMGKLFECVEKRPAISRNKNPSVSILIATNKR